MTSENEIPAGYVLARTTPVFDQDSVPAGLLKAHRVATGVWGLAVVETGTLDFTFEDEGSTSTHGPGESVVIPPDRLHHVAPVGEVTFRVEFYREPSPQDEPGELSDYTSAV